MNDSHSSAAKSKLGFLDGITHLFHGKKTGAPAPAASEAAPDALDDLKSNFESAVGGLMNRMEEIRADKESDSPAAQAQATEPAEDDRERRMARLHDQMRADIEAMHQELGTGLQPAELDPLVAELEDLATTVEEGHGSHDLQPRGRAAVVEKVRLESGTLAADRIATLVKKADRAWPDPTIYRPDESEEAIERSRTRRHAETREVFIGMKYLRLAERLVGNVSGWGSDYPNRRSPLWEECVMEGVAAALRGRVIHECIAILERDRDELIGRIDGLIGKEVAALNQALEAGVTSLGQANQAMAGAMEAIDELVPQVAWEHIQKALPLARGEW